MTTFGQLLSNDVACTCADGLCQKHDAPTPAEDMYTMVNMLRTKLHPPNDEDSRCPRCLELWAICACIHCPVCEELWVVCKCDDEDLSLTPLGEACVDPESYIL